MPFFKLLAHLSFLIVSIPFLTKNHHQHDKNEYPNANSLRETSHVIPHNGHISYIE